MYRDDVQKTHVVDRDHNTDQPTGNPFSYSTAPTVTFVQGWALVHSSFIQGCHHLPHSEITIQNVLLGMGFQGELAGDGKVVNQLLGHWSKGIMTAPNRRPSFTFATYHYDRLRLIGQEVLLRSRGERSVTEASALPQPSEQFPFAVLASMRQLWPSRPSTRQPAQTPEQE
jgi:hypothetical protein